jgi:hypothetical protein
MKEHAMEMTTISILTVRPKTRVPERLDVVSA